ncbi:uncharacterized protein LOC107041450 [Diachasma alloeum]|uniref:uncharacterized protein LOC107041450 n=1 Tax=Diachasma alloeum TaxID=454923 RepID=UPI00073815BD|nr:uncharacterized protein LOC107041450 [Diachasma alloeum]
MIGSITRILGRVRQQFNYSTVSKARDRTWGGPWRSREGRYDRCQSSEEPHTFYKQGLSLFPLGIKMPRTRRRHRSRTHSRSRSHSANEPQFEHKRRRIDYESPQSKGTYR